MTSRGPLCPQLGCHWVRSACTGFASETSHPAFIYGWISTPFIHRDVSEHLLQEKPLFMCGDLHRAGVLLTVSSLAQCMSLQH